MSWWCDKPVDGWLTTPPDDSGYCPFCYAGCEDLTVYEGEVFCRCGWSGSELRLLTRAEMIRAGREDAALARADL